MLNREGRQVMFKGRPLWLEPVLDDFGMIKKDEMGYFVMAPQGLAMLDEMGQPIRLDEQIIFLTPIMEEDGKQPQIDAVTFEARMYPQGVPLRNPFTG
jgi:hypothetical protein